MSEADSLEIIVTQSDSYLMPGDELEISVFQSCQSRYPMEKVLIGGMVISVALYGVYVLFGMMDLNEWINRAFAVLLFSIFGWFIINVERKEFQRLPMVGKFF